MRFCNGSNAVTAVKPVKASPHELAANSSGGHAGVSAAADTPTSASLMGEGGSNAHDGGMTTRIAPLVPPARHSGSAQARSVPARRRLSKAVLGLFGFVLSGGVAFALSTMTPVAPPDRTAPVLEAPALPTAPRAGAQTPPPVQGTRIAAELVKTPPTSAPQLSGRPSSATEQRALEAALEARANAAEMGTQNVAQPSALPAAPSAAQLPSPSAAKPAAAPTTPSPVAPALRSSPSMQDPAERDAGLPGSSLFMSGQRSSQSSPASPAGAFAGAS